MNQILYKGYTFGGVGEDVTNKQHTITLDEQELETVGGENSEVFNNYKGYSINIAEGQNSTVVGGENRELKYIKRDGQYIRSTGATENNFISGARNLILTGYYCFLSGNYNTIQSGLATGIIGQGNKAINSGESFVCGRTNILEDNIAGGLLVGGAANHVENSYQGIVCGQSNTVTGGQSPVVFGQSNIVNGIYSGGMVMGRSNKVKNLDSGNAVFGSFNEVNQDGSYCNNGTFICGDSNKVSQCNFGTIVGGNANNVSGSHCTLVVGYGVKTSSSDYALIGGTRCNFPYAYASLLNGYDSSFESSYISIAAAGFSSGGSLQYSILNGDNIKIGHTSELLGVVEDMSSSDKNIMSDYTTVELDLSSITYGYVCSITYSLLPTSTLDGRYIGRRYSISQQKYYARNNNLSWVEIQESEISQHGPYLGTVIDNLYNSSQSILNKIDIVEFRTSIRDYNIIEYDRVQQCDSNNYTLLNTHIFLNNQWELATESNIPHLYSLIHSVVQGRYHEINSETQCSQIFGYKNNITKTNYSFITGKENNIATSSEIEGSRVLGAYNTISQSKNITTIGDRNTCNFGSNYSTLIGHGNYIWNGSDNCAIIGKDNYTQGSVGDCYIFGNSNVINANVHNSYAIGSNNLMTGGETSSLTLGFNNSIGQSSGIGRNICIGYNNIGSQGGVGNIFIGIDNTSDMGGQFTTLLGYGLKTSYTSKGRTVLGRFNAIESQYPQQIVVGNGYTDNGTVVRQNSLTIDDNGKTVININNAVYGGMNCNQSKTEFTDNYIGISLDSPTQYSGNTVQIVTGTLEEITSGEYTLVTWTKDTTFSTVNHTFTDYSSVYFTTKEQLSELYSLPTIGTHYWKESTLDSAKKWNLVSGYIDISLSRTTAPTIEAHNIIDYNNNEYYIKGVSESNPYIRTKTAIETVSSVTNGIQTIKFENATITSGYGIGQVDITPNKIIVTSYNNNLDDEKETVEFTFEDLQLIKQISQLPNLDNNSYPIPV